MKWLGMISIVDRLIQLVETNDFGLYDMSGNVWEWCWDRYGSYSSGRYTTIRVWTGRYRVYRGGSWYDDAKNSLSYRIPPTQRANTLGRLFMPSVFQLKMQPTGVYPSIPTCDTDPSPVSHIAGALFHT